MDVKETLKRVYEINIADDDRLIEIAKRDGDGSLLQRAQADRQANELKLAKLEV